MLHLVRFDQSFRATLGRLLLDESLFCYTLEPAIPTVQPGSYTVNLTVSNRAKAGTLWTPNEEFKLPLITSDTLPASEGIRIHAGNQAENTQGCVLVGDIMGIDETLEHSRIALIRLLNTVTFPTTLEIK